MKIQKRNFKKNRKTKNKLIKKSRKSKYSKKVKKHNKTKLLRKKKKQNTKKRTKMVMKGGALPFSELNPSNVIDQIKYGFSSSLFGGHFSDNAQHVPNNLPHKVSPSVVDQPYLDGKINEPVAVAGDSPEVHFAIPS